MPVYLVGIASPGPSNFAAASAGRRAALWFTLGVVFGYVFWGVLAALGLAALLALYSGLLSLINGRCRLPAVVGC